MKRIVEAIADSFNLAYMIREGEPDKARLLNAAQKVINRLDGAVDSIAEYKEAKRVYSSSPACSGQGCCNHLQCSKNGR